jgi:redox-sensing transcriptional repressor
MSEIQNHLKSAPKSAIKRLALYSRALNRLEMNGAIRISSRILAAQLGITPAQVRKDLAYFGQFGVPGFGYKPKELRRQIRKILGTDEIKHVAIVGVGNLGRALLSYVGFKAQGFKFTAAFDSDPRKIGRTINHIKIQSINDLEKILQKKRVDIVILAVPMSVVQEVMDRLVKCHITAILNFVPQRLVVPPSVKVHYVDLAMELESLSFYLH